MKNVQLVWRALVWALAVTAGTCCGQSLQTLQTFQLPELFGVSWPTQPIEFRYNGSQPPPLASTRMLGPSGTEVPYQWVSSCSDPTAINGCILVSGNLPANANYTWTLQSGTAPQATVTNPVTFSVVNSTPTTNSPQGVLMYYQLTNGLTGIRIISPASNIGVWNMAPIQGILLPNGAWTGVGSESNLLYSESKTYAGYVGMPLQTPMYTVTGYSVSFTDMGPMKTVMQISYTFNRPQYSYGNEIINTAGQGHYTLNVTMYANSKSILIDEDSDMQFSYYLPVYAQLMPDQARFRGASSPSPICGYQAAVPVTAATNATPAVLSASYSLWNGQQVEVSGIGGNTAANGIYYAQTSGYPSGQFALYQDAALTMPVAGSGNYTGGGVLKPVYLGWQLTTPQDAYLDLTYTSDRPPAFSCSATTYGNLVSYYPPQDIGRGWYVEMYNSTAGSTAPVFGVYEGRVSKQIGSDTGPNTPGIYTSNKHWISGTIDAGIELVNDLRGNANNIVADTHRNWAIWVSTQADLLPTTQHQPIATDENTLASINLSHLYSYQLTYPDPPGGWQWLYLTSAGAQQLISWVRNGTSVCGSVTCYFNLLSNSSDAPTQSILQMWQGDSTAAVQTALSAALATTQAILNAIANGDNHWYEPYNYYQIGLYTTPFTPLLNAVIMDNNSTTSQKTLAKAMLALFGCILWDDDWFPIDEVGGAGLTNQTEQYYQYRTEFAAAAPSQPVMASDMATAVSYTTNEFDQYFSPTGAVPGSTHYQATFFDPLIINFQALTLAGYLNMNDPKWTAYASWELSTQTPPEPRFGNVLKGYSNGDGNTEGDPRTGVLATALNSANPSVASNLMWAWQQSNDWSLTEDTSIDSAVFINPTIPAVMPQLGSINIPGYHSVERFGFGTPHDTVSWFIDGGFYSLEGHRHYDDGQVSIYAHAAPLAIDFNANLYYPETPGRFIHDSIVYDSELPNSWSADEPLLSYAPTLMYNPTNTEFGAFANSTTASATFSFPTDGTVWTRTVRTMAFDPTYPVIYVTDSFSGPSAATGKTLSWNMMATGPVTTPAGPITPISRFSAGCQDPAGALPSNGTVNSLGTGLQQFHFTGFTWPKHATGGINWDLFSLSSTTGQQFLIGNWGHGCNNLREMSEYQVANGAPFAEIQDILRIHGAGPFTTIILPYRKTETPGRTVTQQSCGVQIVQGSEITCFTPSEAQYSNGAKSILTVYDSSTQSAFGVTAAGGPQEVVIQTGQIVWTLSGVEAGTRSLTLPGMWYPSQPIFLTGSTFSYAFPGGQQTAPVTITFTPIP
jgi:hypothetical protein